MPNVGDENGMALSSRSHPELAAEMLSAHGRSSSLLYLDPVAVSDDNFCQTRHTIKEASVNEGAIKEPVDQGRIEVGKGWRLPSRLHRPDRTRHGPRNQDLKRETRCIEACQAAHVPLHLNSSRTSWRLRLRSRAVLAWVTVSVPAMTMKEASAAAWAGERAWVLEDAEDVAKSQRKISRLETSSKP
ncbi:hypothetical protein JB92DRAFT_2824993 [Gautieria morchelliformis]|nr:hypothetical protein JB92DRAFT_2824993 [Gautieria morchelliformis]